MMKLKHLFSNEDLAEMLLKNWEHDEDYKELFKYFRVSSNAIYPFKANGEVHFLRFAPKTEKRKDDVLAELDFIHYLRSHDYPALEPVKSKENRELIDAETPWGKYLATVFKRVKGEQLSDTNLNDDIIYRYGKALGRLHQLSSSYSPDTNKRWSYEDALQWITNTLEKHPNETLALQEAKILNEFLSNLTQDKHNYGLVHYDFECDNVFFDEESQSCNVIDFDDAMYHWYVIDIEQALDSIKEHIAPEKYQQKKQCFIDGYNTEYSISSEMLNHRPVFRRFANLYGYTRILRSMEVTWKNEPEWMEKLRKLLAQSLENRSSSFGDEI